MEENQMPEQNSIMFQISLDQAERLVRYYGKEMQDLEDYEICELLDKYLDEIEN